MLPVPINEENLDLPESTLEGFRICAAFICERVRTFRRLVKYLDHPMAIDDMTLVEMDKHKGHFNPELIEALFRDHNIVGVVSEAGCPGIADPGYRYVEWAHKNDVKVRSFVGPNSILLALMSSGFSGQKFSFHGYLDQNKNQLSKDLSRLEKESQRTKTCQIFMETPYRNRQVLEVALAVLSDDTRLHIAADIRSGTEYCRTQSVSEWKRTKAPDLHKRPAIFILKA